MKIMFLGAPGAGKGTQAEVVSEALSIPAISTGAIIRSAIKQGTETGLLAKTYTDRGALVPDDVVVGIVKERLAADDCRRGFILDGFPRTLAQAEALDAMGIELDLVLSIEVPDEEIIDRMGGRRVCSGCGATYHMKYNPSEKGERCERCDQPLTVRKDDAPEVVLSRLAGYHKETAPLKDYYKAKGILKMVRGQERVEDTTDLIMKAVGIEPKA
ncbi:MAG: adenylate kinase [Clostridiales bacterium]|nr:adenylate kinase [Clostridiales bacterium]